MIALPDPRQQSLYEFGRRGGRLGEGEGEGERRGQGEEEGEGEGDPGSMGSAGLEDAHLPARSAVARDASRL